LATGFLIIHVDQLAIEFRWPGSGQTAYRDTLGRIRSLLDDIPLSATGEDSQDVQDVLRYLYLVHDQLEALTLSIDRKESY
jgi:hypothetical protein